LYVGYADAPRRRDSDGLGGTGAQLMPAGPSDDLVLQITNAAAGESFAATSIR
jgi:hypothetical protein